jgi:hypothetical protein
VAAKVADIKVAVMAILRKMGPRGILMMLRFLALVVEFAWLFVVDEEDKKKRWRGENGGA